MSQNIRSRKDRPEYRPYCLRSLYEVLGQSDATIEWVEVAVRHLGHEYNTGGEARMIELAAHYKVRVNPVDIAHVSTRWACLQILSVYQCVEWFLDEFHAEHPRKVRGRNKEEDLLSYTLDAFGVRKSEAGMLEFEVIDYYRLIRNHLMHKPLAPQGTSHVTQMERIRKMKEDTKYTQLSAPNPLGSINFDDFILFARALKQMAGNLCALSCPSADEMFVAIKQDQKLLRSLHATMQNKNRVKAKLTTYLQTQYGFPTTASEVSTKLLDIGLLA